MPRHDAERDDYREPPRSQSSNATVIVLIVVVAVLLVVVVACGGLFFLGWRTADRLEEMAAVNAEAEAAKANEDAARTYPKKTADELVAEWSQNPAAAADKYKTNGVELTGILHAMGTNMDGETWIDVRGPRRDDDSRIKVFVVSARARSGLKSVRVGGRVVVKARPDGSTDMRPKLVADQIRAGD